MPSVIHRDDVKARRVEFGHIRGDWFDLSRAAGSVEVGMRRIRVDAGGFSTPAHTHSDDEETFFVLAGSGLLWQDGATCEIRAGDAIVHPDMSPAHTLRAGEEGLDVLVFGHSRERRPGAFLPRIGLFWSRPSWVDAPAENPPFAREAAIGPPECPPPGNRPANVVALEAVETGTTDRDGYRETSRGLGAAAGARRTGLNHAVLEPGQMSCPPHCHSAEEELFVVLDGEGVLQLWPRDGGEPETHPLRGGSIVARPAGTRVSHALVAGAGGLTYLVFGTRDSKDICWYPRSQKVYIRGVGLMTRVECLDYWDGEP